MWEHPPWVVFQYLCTLFSDCNDKEAIRLCGYEVLKFFNQEKISKLRCKNNQLQVEVKLHSNFSSL